MARGPIPAAGHAAIVVRCPGSTMLLASRQPRKATGAPKYLPIVEQIVLFGVPGSSLQERRRAQLSLCCGTQGSCRPHGIAVGA
jgi:hypothetical protein